MHEFWTFASLHHGVFSRAEARAYGVSNDQLKRMIARGEAVRIYPSTYRLVMHQETWFARARAATASTNGVISHRGAAALWGIDGFRPGRIELTVDYKKPITRPNITIHRTRQFNLIDACELNGLPVTGASRTILDLFAVLQPSRMQLALDAALRMKLVDWPDLRNVLDAHSEHGRDGCGKIRAFLDAVDTSARVPDSRWNRQVADAFFDAGLPEPRLEFEVRRGDGSFVARVDLAYPRHRVAIELDSVRWHHNQKSFEADPRRKNALLLEGWRVLTFTWSDFTNFRSQMISTVRAALDDL